MRATFLPALALWLVVDALRHLFAGTPCLYLRANGSGLRFTGKRRDTYSVFQRTVEGLNVLESTVQRKANMLSDARFRPGGEAVVVRFLYGQAYRVLSVGLPIHHSVFSVAVAKIEDRGVLAVPSLPIRPSNRDFVAFVGFFPHSV